MKRIVVLAICAFAALVDLTAAVAAPSAAVHRQKIVGAYRLTLRIGPAEAMAMHPKGRGERMLGGKMAACQTPGNSMGGMSMGSATCNRHVEVHVVNRHTGKVVTGARVTIRLTNVRTHRSIGVPIMTMMGAGASRADFHYGNNIHAVAGTYSVVVTVNRTTARFNVRLR